VSVVVIWRCGCSCEKYLFHGVDRTELGVRMIAAIGFTIHWRLRHGTVHLLGEYDER
jgi:hypothetical protein